MSSHSYSSPCPHCEEDMNCWSDNKPYDTVGGECLHCGFNYWTVTETMPLDEIHERRVAQEYGPLMGDELKKFLEKTTTDKLSAEVKYVSEMQDAKKWCEEKECPHINKKSCCSGYECWENEVGDE